MTTLNISLTPDFQTEINASGGVVNGGSTWAYAAVYRTRECRTRALPAWIDYSNTQRPHGALGHKTRQPP